MNFLRYGRHEDFCWTAKKLAKASTKPARQLKKMHQNYPLIADVLPTPAAFSADEEAQRRQQSNQGFELGLRTFHARVWREARRDFFAASFIQREAIRRGWSTWAGPRTSLYFRYVVDLHTGVIQARSSVFIADQVRLIHQVRQQRIAQDQFDFV